MKPERPNARRALLDAFAELALNRRYQDVGVGLIAETAGVARSTFYYHFGAKDDLLLDNLKPMLAALARSPSSVGPDPEVEQWMTHIWRHRVRAKRMLDGATGRRIENALTTAIQRQFELSPADGSTDAMAPLRAHQMAGAMLSLLRAWVDARAPASAAEISHMLWSGGRLLAGASSASRP